ncbi:MAG: choice-of-anchor D domain-containing protein [Acidobacteriota bacterium]
MKHRLAWVLLVASVALAGSANAQIQFRQGSTVIPDGSTYDFGSTPVGVDLTRPITLVNVGSTAINVSHLSVSSNAFDPGRFTTSNADIGVIPPGGTGGFDATYTSTGAGTVTNEIRLLVNGVPTYSFFARATATAPIGPVIELRQGGTTIQRNDLVNFGTTTVGSDLVRTFTVTNGGDQNLTIAPIGFAGGTGNPISFSVDSNNVNNVAPGNSATFTLRFEADSVGTRTNRVRLFVGGVSDFEFDVRGTANPAPAPNMVLKRNSATISPDGSVSLGATDFGDDLLATFTITNTGNATLNVGGVTWTGNEVSIATSPPSTVPAGGSRNFTLRFSGDNEGGRASVISVTSDDPSPNPYRFTANWTVNDAIGPIIQLRQGGTTVAQGSTFDFGDTGVGQQIVRTFTATNGGDQPLTIAPISISSNGSDPAAFHAQNNQVTNVAPGASRTFQLRFDAAGLGTVTSEIRLFVNGVSRYSFFATAETKAPSFVVNVSPGTRTVQRGQATTYTVAVSGQFGFSSSVALSLSGLPGGTSHTFTPVNVSPGSTSTLRVTTTASTPLVTRTLTVTGTGGGLTRTDTTRLVVIGNQDFTVDVSPSARSVQRGQSAIYTVSVNPVNGFSTGVSLSISGLPTGTSHTFTPATVTPGNSSTLEVTTSSSTPLVTRTLTITGSGGGISRSDTAQLTVTDQPPVGEPVIDSVSPDTIVHGGVHFLTLSGANFQGATVSVPDEAPDPSDPMTRIFPPVSVESINGNGTQMTVRVDASDTRVLDFYNLLVTNSAGEEGVPFRVLPAGPLVDTWTPAEPERGNAYVLSLVGHNLRNVTVSPSQSGRVRIFGLDNSRANRTNAILQVFDNAPLGPINLVVRDPSGRSVSLPINIRAPGSASLLTRNLMAEQQPTDQLGPRGAPSAPQPAVFFQDFTLREGPLTVVSGENVVVLDKAMAGGRLVEPVEANLNIAIYCRIKLDLVRFHWQVALIFDPDTGEIGDAVLQGLNLGQRADIGAFVLSFYLDVDLFIYFRCDLQGWSFPLFCLRITSGLEIPGRSGFAFVIDFCFGGGGDNFTSGSTDTLVVTGGPCAEVTPQGPPSEGLLFASVEQTDCCDQPISVAGSGSTFTGLGFGTNFNVNNPEAGTSTSDCGPGGCSVSISQPPACVARNRMRTFNASGNPSGGSFQWSIPQGGNRASIEGANNQSSVSVKGTATSQQADDVELKVTYTDPQGNSCSQTTDLSVIEVDLIWRNSGTLDPMFNAPAVTDGNFGLPTLGPVSPNNPPGTVGWFKNMEIKGKVTPCDPNLRCDFDFKRDRQGTVGFLQLTGPGQAQFQPEPNLDCPQGGCDDDPNELDEDHDLDGPPGCGVFVLDVPGLSVGSACTPTSNNGLFIINCLTFEEWLNVDGVRGSDIQRWNASTRVFCDGNSWQLNGLGQGNRMGVGTLDCSRQAAIPTGGPAPNRIEVAYDVDSILKRLFSGTAAERMAAAAEVVDWDASGTLNGGSRDDLAKMLRRMVGRPAQAGEEFATPLQAIRLLGTLRDSGSTALLISHIGDEFVRPDVDAFEDITPAAVALAQIGQPAIGAILDRAAVADEAEWSMLTKALRRMPDSADVADALAPRLAAASDLELKRLSELME